MNMVLTSSIPMRDGAWPLLQPTHRLTWHTLRNLAPILQEKPFDQPMICIMSLDALNLVKREAFMAEDERLLNRLYELRSTDFVQRLDWVNGQWVSREPDTPEHYNASYEDAVFLLEHEPKARAVLRYRRVMDSGFMATV